MIIEKKNEKYFIFLFLKFIFSNFGLEYIFIYSEKWILIT